MTSKKITLADTMLELSEGLYADGIMDVATYREFVETFGKKAQPKTMHSNELLKIRSALNISQATLAEIIGVSTSTVSKWETNQSPISSPIALLLRILNQHGLGILFK